MPLWSQLSLEASGCVVPAMSIAESVYKPLGIYFITGKNTQIQKEKYFLFCISLNLLGFLGDSVVDRECCYGLQFLFSCCLLKSEGNFFKT